MADALRGLGWDHPRCTRPLRAVSTAYALEHPEVTIDWEVRSLAAFNDQPLAELARDYDLLTVDHPFVGTVARDGTLLPLEELMGAERVARLRLDDAGGSQRSYEWAGRHWALAIDAACHVSAVRPDLLRAAGEVRPRSWADLASLAARHPHRVLWPLYPTDAICSLLTLHASHGYAIATLDDLHAAEVEAALDVLLTVLPHLHPDSLSSNPPRALDLASSTDEVWCIPLTFGYGLYAQADGGHRAIRFGPAPTASTSTGVLGGAGLGVSARSSNRAACAAFLTWLGDRRQHDAIVEHGGQPGRRSAWERRSGREPPGGFFRDTLTSLDAAATRPRDPWWPRFQEEGGEVLHAALASRAAPAQIAGKLAELLKRLRG